MAVSPQRSVEQLVDLVEQQANVIVATGTGQGRFDDFDAEYQRRDRTIVEQFKRLGLTPPFPWRSLWEWHGYYSQELPSYASRRVHVATLKREALDRIEERLNDVAVHDPEIGHPISTWDGIDARVKGLIDEYTGARDKDAWQDVGRRSREILIDLGKLVADPSLVPDSQDPPRGADARAWFELFLNTRANGSDRAELRAVMRKTWDLAQKVTHGDIDDVDAFAAAQATVLLVRTTGLILRQAGEEKYR